ncbi:MAG: site-specific integrase [Oscillospiraceae bacterium]|nr:site-specific integrase [Oscillospiraceae bacterium]
MSRRKSKRAPNGSGSIRRKGNSWEARITVGTDANGRQIQRSFSAPTQAEAQRIITENLHLVNIGAYIAPTKMTVAEWLNEWESTYLVGVKTATVKSYQDHIRLNINPYIGGIRLQRLAPDMVQRMFVALLRDKGLSPKTIKNVHGVLHRALEQAIIVGYIHTNPLNGVQLPRIEKKEANAMEDDALRRLLEASSGSPYEHIIFVTAFTGLRESEVLGLTWDCVDFEKNTLYINKQHHKDKLSGDYCFSSLKNDKARKLNVAPSVMAVIKAEQEKQNSWQQTLGTAFSNDKNLVFTTETGRYISNQTLYCAYRKILKKAGLEGFNFHSLRHTYASNSLRAGDDIKTVQENLGHHTAAFTLEKYGHATDEMKAASAERMEEFTQNFTNKGN